MKTFDIEVENFGPIKRGKVETSRLNIICGPNNSGKSMFLHSFYAFLRRGVREFLSISVPPEVVNAVKSTGTVKIALSDYRFRLNDCLTQATNRIIESKTMPFWLSKQEVMFQNAKFHISTNLEYLLDNGKESGGGRFQVTENCICEFEKSGINDTLVITFKNTGNEYPDETLIKDAIESVVRYVLTWFVFFTPAFLLTSERIGAAIFTDDITLKKERDIQMQKNVPPPKSFSITHSDELRFVSHANLKTIFKSNSTLIQDEAYKHIFDLLHEIVSGTYIFDDVKGIRFKPDGTILALDMSEVSSSVRSLMSLDVILRHGIHSLPATIMIDEPEINLTPHNQRLFARLLVQLVKAGIDVFITTHSDYIVRELNTLVAFSKQTKHTKKIAKKYQYGDDEHIESDNVALYYLRKPKQMKKNENNAFKRIHLNGDPRLDIPPFDESIDEMVRTQTDLSLEWRNDE